MGRCPEDGQVVLFESTTDRASDLFCDLETNTWVCRLAVVCADVHAIYTPELDANFLAIAAEVSRTFGEAYYEMVSDEPSIAVLRNGNVWIPEIPQGRRGRAMLRQMEASIFVQSNAMTNGRLWENVRKFV